MLILNKIRKILICNPIRLISRGVGCCIIGIVITSVAFANHETIVVDTQIDNWVEGPDGGIFSNDNYGCEPFLLVGSGGHLAWSTVRFDLDAIPELPKALASATLKLTVWNTFGFSNIEVDVHRILTPWKEGRGARGMPRPTDCVGVDRIKDWDPALGWAYWGDKPTLDPQTSATLFLGEINQGDTFEWDVTSLVQSWIEDSSTNHGLALKGDIHADTKRVEFISHEPSAFPDFSPWDVVRTVGEGPRLVLTFLPAFSCVGFEPPVDDPTIPVSVKKRNRTLPFRAELVDANGNIVTDLNISAPPVIQVIYNPGVSGEEPVDVSDDSLSVGLGNVGNQFDFTDDNKWQFNLKLNQFNASGTYTVTMEPGIVPDEELTNQYLITDTCIAKFVVN